MSIRLTIKGSAAEAAAELKRRGIVPLTPVVDWWSGHGFRLSRATVADSYHKAVTDWFLDAPTGPPFRPGALLHYV